MKPSIHKMGIMWLHPLWVHGQWRFYCGVFCHLTGVFGSLWKGHDKEDKVPASVKQHLLKAQRALRDGDYEAAEEAYHDALRRLATSEYADAQAYIEARAVVLDKVVS